MALALESVSKDKAATLAGVSVQINIEKKVFVVVLLYDGLSRCINGWMIVD